MVGIFVHSTRQKHKILKISRQRTYIVFCSTKIFYILFQYCQRFSITYTGFIQFQIERWVTNILNPSYYTDRFIPIFRLIHVFKNKITYLCAFDRAIVLRSFTSYSVVFYGVCYFRRIMSRQLSLTSSLQRKDILAQSFFKVVKLSFWFFSKFNFRFLKLSQT